MLVFTYILDSPLKILDGEFTWDVYSIYFKVAAMKNFWLILITVIPLNILTGMSSSFPPELNQRPEICKTAFHGGKIFQGKKKSSSKRISEFKTKKPSLEKIKRT